MSTGGLMNLLMDGDEIIPNVGDGATVLLWTDRQAGTVISVTPKEIVVQEDFAIRTDKNGPSDSQEYRYERDPDGIKHVFRMTKNGWKSNGMGVRFGVRNHYYDYGF